MILKLGKIIILSLLLSGCAGLRYQAGFYAGNKDYEDAKIMDKDKGFGQGYREAWRLNQIKDAMEASKQYGTSNTKRKSH